MNLYLSKGCIVFMVLVLLNVFHENAGNCESKAEIVCYYGSWAIYRKDEGKFTSEKIDPSLCTNIIYSFVGLNMDLKVESIDVNADFTLGGFANLTKIKQANPCVKTTLAVGGWNEGSLKYSIMASTEELRKEFAESALKFISYYGFDGLDFDWEYPTSRGGISVDKENFVSLLKTIKTRIAPWGFRLSIAVSIVDDYYNIADIVQNVDFVHLMGYDVTNANSKKTGLLAPLSTIKEKVDIWLNRGLPAEKLILGIPAYARCFNLQDNHNHDIGAPVTNTTCGGVWTDENGFLAFYELQQFIKDGYCQGTEISDGTAYSWCDDVWMTYDNEETVATKVKYVLNKKLGGVMIWSMDTDDFNGMYGNKYTLLSTIYKTINNS